MKKISRTAAGRRRALGLLAGAAALAGGGVIALPVAAQDYPAKPIRLVVPYPPGGGSDIVSRAVAQKIGEALRQQVIVDNKPGAGGNIGTDMVAKAAPDGYTLLMGVVGPLAVNPSLFRNLSYDPVRDFAPITQAVSVTNMLVVHPSLPVKSVAELIAYARSQPGKVAFATAGPGTAGHMAAELFKSTAKLDVPIVPYKGAAPAVNDVLAGQVMVCFEGLLSTLPHVRAGKLRALGVTTAVRSSLLPEVPTIAETGLPGYEANNWYGFLAPARTPKPIIDRLHKEMAAALNAPDVKEKLAALGADVIANTPEQFALNIRNDAEKWRRIVAETGARAD